MASLRVGTLGCLLLACTLSYHAAYGQEPTPAQQPEVAAQPAPQAQSAPATAIAPAQPNPAAAGNLPHNLSPWGMFMAADWVVKAVMIGLAFASLVTWTIWLAKTLELAGARLRAYRALKAIGNASTLLDAERELEGKGGPGVLFVHAAREEVRISLEAQGHASADGLKERVASRLSRIEAQAGRRMSRGTGVLATIGSTAPFVGLFGTVWGIMNSFIGISQSQTTNLAIVAPGIAEALLATAIGLVAAIPAVVIYNVFARSITGYRQLLADASAGVERLVSRDVDFALVPKSQQQRAAAAE
ncbi:tonB-system energizer ExbB [Phyllobacterium brassicacearum]|uniref:Biopolymer transport protein ExbB n=2 Tax=Phyllobacterium brassicacearum TaxID=314235 RepID=A0A2P7BE87_9HYPH|nr:tonB-system energizer ExbB [Phyllobacterium brassicacearum]